MSYYIHCTQADDREKMLLMLLCFYYMMLKVEVIYKPEGLK